MKKGVMLGLAGLILLFFLCSLVCVSAADVGYILLNSRNANPQVISVFSEMNLSYDLLLDSKISVWKNNLSMYRFLFIDDARLRNAGKIYDLIAKYPSVVMNRYYGTNWGLTDTDGISQFTSTAPLNVKLVSDDRVQVYTQAREGVGGSFIPFYYLADENKANFTSVARAFEGGGADNIGDSNELGDVIAYAKQGTTLKNGKITKGKVCYYGIAKTKYWTDEARHLFKDCIGFVSSLCSRDSDCPSETLGGKYCIGNDIYQDFSRFRCINPGTVHSQCVDGAEPRFNQTCQYACLNGMCIRCDENNDCNDNNSSTEDRCINPGDVDSRCGYESIRCFENIDCGVDRFIGNAFCSNSKNLSRNFITFTCNNPGTALSSCTNSTEVRLVQTCLDTCLDGQCKTITCYNDSECDDQDIWTEDHCLNPGTLQSECTNLPIRCFQNTDCGVNSLSGNVCSGLNVVKNFLNWTCNNPGIASSYCSNQSGDYLIKTCSKQCTLGQCVDINCTKNEDCIDLDARTFDQCVNPNTTASYCRHTEINCLNDLDCGFTGFAGNEYCFEDDIFKNYQTSTCNNPGTLNSNCVNSISSQFKQDCGSDYCGNFSGTYCKNDDVYHSRMCFDVGCLAGSCFMIPNEQESLVEECDYGCVGGVCKPQCNINSDCGNKSSIIYCDGNLLVNTTTTPVCVNGSCGLSVINSTTLCEFGCENNECIPGIHDVALLLSYPDSVNGIRIKDQDTGLFVPGEPAELLTCKDYEFRVQIRNEGDYIENVRVEGEINGGNWNENKNSFGIGSTLTSIGDKILDFNGFLPGIYDTAYEIVLLTASDDDLSDNTRTRQINLNEAVCSSDSDCGSDGFGGNYCIGKDVYHDFTNYTCENPCSFDSSCTHTIIPKFVKECDVGCENGECVECTQNSDCNDGLWCNGPEACVNNVCVPATAPCTYFVDECTDVTCNEAIDSCVETPVQDCCMTNADCNDGNECTNDVCVNHNCETANKPDQTLCGSFRNCPASHCANPFWKLYPADGHDRCISGTCIEYDCTLIDSFCKLSCGAECEDSGDCDDSCDGNNRLSNGNCLGDCSCSYDSCEEDTLVQDYPEIDDEIEIDIANNGYLIFKNGEDEGDGERVEDVQRVTLQKAGGGSQIIYCFDYEGKCPVGCRSHDDICILNRTGNFLYQNNYADEWGEGPIPRTRVDVKAGDHLSIDFESGLYGYFGLEIWTPGDCPDSNDLCP